MWTLANEHASWIEYKKDKDLKYWYTASNMSEFKYYSAERMIQYLVENNELSNLYFRYLEPICRKEIHISNRELYVFKVEVKKEYKEYLKKTKNETINS